MVNLPVSAMTVQLTAGANTIPFGNASYYAPDIDKITVAPAVLR